MNTKHTPGRLIADENGGFNPDHEWSAHHESSTFSSAAPLWLGSYEELEHFVTLVEAAARADEREVVRKALAYIPMVPTLTHGNLVKLSDVDAAIRARSQS
jgi:hypothetical protein